MSNKPKIKYTRKVVKLDDLKLDPANPNKMTDIKKAGLNKSLDKFGYVDEICVEKGSLIVANGEHRIAELKKMGIKEIEVKLFKFKNEAERRLFRQVFNKSGGEHDIALDKEEFKFLDENDSLSDLAELLGEDEIDFVYEDEEELPELDKKELDVTLTR
jgi:hypothetical protein